jgi:hypothetical protein
MQDAGCHAVLSANGSTMIFSDGRGPILVASADGRVLRKVPGLVAMSKPEDRSSFDVASVSADGHRAALRVTRQGAPVGDAARNLYANEIIDTASGKTLITHDKMQVLFRPDGGMVTRLPEGDGYEVVITDATGRELQRIAEPAGLEKGMLLAMSR